MQYTDSMKHFAAVILVSTFFLAACQQSPSVSDGSTSSKDRWWQTYEDMPLGISVGYPSDVYTVTALPGGDTLFFGEKTIEIDTGIHMGDNVPEGSGVQIYRTQDPLILEYLQQDKPFTNTKTVNGVEYRQFEFLGMGDVYGYVTQKNDYYYVFSSTWGPDNPVSEKILQSLIFE